MSWAPTGRLLAYPWLIAGLLLAALAAGRPELAAAAAPLAAVLLAGLLSSRRPEVPGVRLAASESRIVEGDRLDLTVEVSVPSEVESLEVAVAPPPGADLVDSSNPQVVTGAAGAPRASASRCATGAGEPTRWGPCTSAPSTASGCDGSRRGWAARRWSAPTRGRSGSGA